MFPVNLYTTSGLLMLLHGIISHPDATSYDKYLVCELLSSYIIGPVKQKFQHKIVITFLSFSLNMCFVYSNEPSH